MTTTGASHWAPSGATAPSVARRRSPRTSWRPTGRRRASRFSVVHSPEETSPCATAGRGRAETPIAARNRTEASLRKTITAGHYHQISRRLPVVGGVCDSPVRNASDPGAAHHGGDGPGQRLLRRGRVFVRQDPAHPPRAAGPRREAAGPPAADRHP